MLDHESLQAPIDLLRLVVSYGELALVLRPDGLTHTGKEIGRGHEEPEQSEHPGGQQKVSHAIDNLPVEQEGDPYSGEDEHEQEAPGEDRPDERRAQWNVAYAPLSPKQSDDGDNDGPRVRQCRGYGVQRRHGAHVLDARVQRPQAQHNVELREDPQGHGPGCAHEVQTRRAMRGSLPSKEVKHELVE